jgi:hypothetical protein
MRLHPALRLAASCAALLAFAGAAHAVEPVRQIGVYVKPFYAAGATLVDLPTVAVDPAYDKLLASDKRADIVKVRDAIAAAPERVKPTTLVVLSIRLYDVGLRDDAVFWFYVARDRYTTMESVLDMNSLTLVGMARAMDDFVGAVGPAINGYAFCDIARQQAQEEKALAWVASHPYRLLESLDLPATADDRNAALGAALARLREAQMKAAKMLDNPETLAEMKSLRAHNQADERFCWK